MEDDFTSQLLLHKLLEPYGKCDIVANGWDAVEAFRLARSMGEPYSLLCLDIMVPGLDGQEVLRKIRELEAEREILPGKGVKILMTTALMDGDNVLTAFRELCDGYLVKPIDRAKLLRNLRELALTE